MKFTEVLPALLKGKKIRKIYWSEDKYVYSKKGEFSFLQQNDHIFIFGVDDFKDDNWEIVKETKKVKLRDLTEEQYSSWFEKNCDWNCEHCCFNTVVCNYAFNRYWLNHKEIYSDKFLDQEIEVED